MAVGGVGALVELDADLFGTDDQEAAPEDAGGRAADGQAPVGPEQPGRLHAPGEQIRPTEESRPESIAGRS